jgi:hypothetical protein
MVQLLPPVMVIVPVRSHEALPAEATKRHV